VIVGAKAELDRYCQRIEKHLPNWSSRFLRWLRQPSSRSARILVSALLVLGGVFSFLPVLGLWMLPLGLIIISQDLPFLRAPLVRAFRWIEFRWAQWQGRAANKSDSRPPARIGTASITAEGLPKNVD
jgi:hypothetical protein